MSRRTMQSRLPSRARPRPSASCAPAAGGSGLPLSMSGELSLRWKSFALTNRGSADVWNFWQELPAVVGPRENVIVQPPVAETPPEPTMLESIETELALLTCDGDGFPATVSFTSFKPVEALDTLIPGRLPVTTSLSIVTR